MQSAKITMRAIVIVSVSIIRMTRGTFLLRWDTRDTIGTAPAALSGYGLLTREGCL